MPRGGTRQLTYASPVPLEFSLEASLGLEDPTEEEIATTYAKTLSKKIKSGIKEIKKYLKREDPIIDYLSGKTSDPAYGDGRVGSNKTYDDILNSFLEDAKRHQRDSRTSGFLRWCSIFNAGSFDSIADSLPRRQVANTETNTTNG